MSASSSRCSRALLVAATHTFSPSSLTGVGDVVAFDSTASVMRFQDEQRIRFFRMTSSSVTASSNPLSLAEEQVAVLRLLFRLLEVGIPTAATPDAPTCP
eukprot:CAMPEP_0119150714 /NCGR_PEP_ID=MMETSP1310-20130426/45301_1 /TAXON_ID=464262 /ORGANISM="Genus nov. species nov., Strain RCC2339" /LENGTH=99 /DNA_ID=CAMNT_0007142937 /DNA_START=63 /DNA_END=358 /DNA_ORIENTATION=+